MNKSGLSRQPNNQCPYCSTTLDSLTMMHRRARKKCKCPKCGKVIDFSKW